ncbi:50S ribosomal subunit protein L19 [Wigglesworthia glossinidia endosymbiont of Glossina morsitans morsitans (Yale colony)]|uniref:Large ribosomal subunit protein bL19 n=1 Tax=Wigglesworthia glossinidia endosymbiont of Glossina morsitans morsitans (Yale colony) TaxID=1142511 RepID=H6Q565_WIGGL|nr:50S ribosomal protein L19 [Wigglesworthia glossinidia]AFA41348.1 50S ribosomal subunit protein L19 [Wigglesworthia glossinidia endosymbiont of Glossina morsitans morsitans (Yale colony)]
MNNIIKSINDFQIKKNLPKFCSGDIVKIRLWIVEGEKKRIQIFEGMIIAMKNKHISSSITLRKISNGEGVERLFHIHSPIIESFIVQRHSIVRKSKLYYLRYKSGKSARVKERL